MRWRSSSSRLAAALAAAALWAAPAAGTSVRFEGRDYSPYPNPDVGLVSDHAHVLSGRDEGRIEEWLEAVEDRTGVQIVVVTVRSIGDYDVETNRSVEAFARGLFDAYGIGRREANDGVLLLVCVRDGKARVELGAGHGRRRDEDTRRIVQEEIMPHFERADYGAGVLAGVEAIMEEFAGVRRGRSWLVLLTLPVALIAVPIAWSLVRSGKTGWGWVCAGLVIILALLAVKIVSVLLDILLTRRRRRWYSDDDDAVGGFWSGVGGGSGGRSSGGGFSGGGGATGSW